MTAILLSRAFNKFPSHYDAPSYPEPLALSPPSDISCQGSKFRFTEKGGKGVIWNNKKYETLTDLLKDWKVSDNPEQEELNAYSQIANFFLQGYQFICLTKESELAQYKQYAAYIDTEGPIDMWLQPHAYNPLGEDPLKKLTIPHLTLDKTVIECFALRKSDFIPFKVSFPYPPNGKQSVYEVL